MPPRRPDRRARTSRPGPAKPPTCRHFGRCGACDRLDQPIEEQLRDKVAEVEHLLHPFLGGQRVAHEVPRRTPLHDRTRLLYPARPGRGGRATLGHFAFRSHEVVRITECRTQDEGLTAFGTRAETILGELRIPAFDPQTGRGIVRALHGRICPGTGEFLIGVVTGPGVFDQGTELAERLMAAAEDLPHSGHGPIRPVGVVRSISDRDDDFLLGTRHVPLAGRDHQVDRADGLTFRISFGSFYQIHRDAGSLLYRPALAMAGDLRAARVVDGYGGVGTFGLRCARAGAAQVEIVEDNPAACRDAVHNAERNGLSTVQVLQAKFTNADFAPAPDLLIVDPPRSGLKREGVARVLAARPRRLLHAACSAESLAQDLEGLLGGGWSVRSLRLCDLFPHTGHVELVALLEQATVQGR